MAADAFAQSALGAFTKSALGVRNAAAPTFPIDVVWSAATRSGRLLLDIAEVAASEVVSGYACHNVAGSQAIPSPLDATVRTGRVPGYRVIPETERRNALEALRACPGNGILTTNQDGEWFTAKPVYDTDFGGQFGAGAWLSNDVLDAQRMVVLLKSYAPADLVVGLSACSGSGGWQPEDPPAGVFNGPTSAGATKLCYAVFQRSGDTAAWTLRAGPYVVPVVGVFAHDLVLPNETTDRVWAIGDTAAKAEVYDLDADYATATVNSITLPTGQGSVQEVRQWGRFVIFRRFDGSLNVYHDETHLGDVGSPFAPGTAYQWDVGFGWMAIAQSNKVYLYELDDAGASFSLDTTLSPSGTVTSAALCGAAVGVFGQTSAKDIRVMRRSGGSWSAHSAIAAAETLYDEGYVWTAAAQGYLLMYSAAKSPTTRYVVVS